MTFSSNGGATLEAADAYVDFGTNQTADLFKVTIEITQPNSGSSHHILWTNFHVQDVFFADIILTFLPDVRYFTGNADVFEIVIYYSRQDCSSVVNFRRLKVDWFHLEKIDGSAVSGAETPTLKVKEIKFFTLNKTISAV